MKKILGIQKWIVSLAMTAVLCFCTVLPAFAAEETGSFTFRYVVPDCGIRVYQVTRRQGDRFQVTGTFQNVAVDWSDLEAGNWSDLAHDLQAVLTDSSIAPTWEGKTDESGVAQASALPYGLYLVLIQQKTLIEQDSGDTTVKRYTYTAEPLLLALPGASSDGAPQPNMDIQITKYNRTELPETVDITVSKIWRNIPWGFKRPSKVTVKLMQDGKVYDIVELSANNSWRYTWVNLEAEHEWYAVEVDQLTHFQVHYDKNVSNDHSGMTLAVINRYCPPYTPGKPGWPGRLPQTGQDWTSVMVLAGLGTLLLAVGLLLRRRNGGSE